MLEKPALPDAQIVACLREVYGLSAVEIEFLPIGNDSSAWAYRVTAEDGVYFLKIKRGAISPPSVTIPNYLKSQGMEQVVAPLSILFAPLQAGDEAYNLILYPFIDGSTGMDIGLTDDQWREYGTILSQIHAAKLPPELMDSLPREAFALNPKWLEITLALDKSMDVRAHRDDFERELAAFWFERRAEIQRIVERAVTLGQRMQKQQVEFVLCHSDIHTANILLDSDGGMHVVDWDQPMLAPRERDLMFLVGAAIGGVEIGRREEALFFEGYGQAEVDALALAYYRYEWVVQEIGDFGERVFLMDDMGAETKADSVRGFRALFAPGDVVDVAYASESSLAL